MSDGPAPVGRTGDRKQRADPNARRHRSSTERVRLELKKGERSPTDPAAVKLGFTDQEPEPKPQGQKEKTPRRPSKTAKELGQAVTGGLVLILNGADALAHTIAAKVWTKDDRLTETEQGVIAAAIAAEVMRRPKLANRIAGLTDARDRATLAALIVAIMLPRLARHGALPGPLARAIMQALGEDPSSVPTAQPERAAPPPPNEVARDNVAREAAPNGPIAQLDDAPAQPRSPTLDSLSGG